MTSPSASVTHRRPTFGRPAAPGAAPAGAAADKKGFRLHSKAAIATWNGDFTTADWPTRRRRGGGVFSLTSRGVEHPGLRNVPRFSNFSDFAFFKILKFSDFAFSRFGYFKLTLVCHSWHSGLANEKLNENQKPLGASVKTLAKTPLFLG